MKLLWNTIVNCKSAHPTHSKEFLQIIYIVCDDNNMVIYFLS